MSDEPKPTEPTRNEVFLTWVIEAWLELQPLETQRAFAFGIQMRKRIAMAKAEVGLASEPEQGAITLAQTFLDEFRSTSTG